MIPIAGIIVLTVGLFLLYYAYKYRNEEDIISVFLLAIITILVGAKFFTLDYTFQLVVVIPILYFVPFVFGILLAMNIGKKLVFPSIFPTILIAIFVYFYHHNLSISLEETIILIVGYIVLFMPPSIVLNFYFRDSSFFKSMIFDVILAVIIIVLAVLDIAHYFIIFSTLLTLSVIIYEAFYVSDGVSVSSVFEKLKLSKFQKELLRKALHGLVFIIFLPEWILELMVDVGLQYGLYKFFSSPVEFNISYSKVMIGVLISMTSIFLIALLLDYLRAKKDFPLISDVLLREREKNELAGHVYLIGATLFVAVFFNVTILFASIGASVIGDAFAAIVGIRFGKHKIGDRSLEGTIAEFIAVSFVASIFVPVYIAIVLGVVIAITDVLIDGYASDNIVFPLISAFTLKLLL